MPKAKSRSTKVDKSIPSTAHWTPEFQALILRELGKCNDPIRVAYENGVEVVQVMKCIEREQHKIRRISPDKVDFLIELDAKARAGLLLGMEKLAASEDPKDGARLAEICRRLLENTKTMATASGRDRGGDTNINILAIQEEQVKFRHMTPGQLADKALELAAMLKVVDVEVEGP